MGYGWRLNGARSRMPANGGVARCEWAWLFDWRRLQCIAIEFSCGSGIFDASNSGWARGESLKTRFFGFGVLESGG